jgi:hypothetical protein
MAADFTLTFAVQTPVLVPFQNTSIHLSPPENFFEQNKTDFWALIEK